MNCKVLRCIGCGNMVTLSSMDRGDYPKSSLIICSKCNQNGDVTFVAGTENRSLLKCRRCGAVIGSLPEGAVTPFGRAEGFTTYYLDFCESCKVNGDAESQVSIGVAFKL